MRYWIRKIHKIFYFHSNLHFLVQNTGNTFGLTKDNIKIRLYLIVTMMITWTARRPNQAILKEISPEYSLEGLMLKLKLQYFSHLCEELTLWKRAWCWERLRTRREGGDRGWDGWMAPLTQRTWIWANSGRQWRAEKPGMLQLMGATESRTLLSD